MSENSREQNPSGIWQGIWAELFKISNEHLISATARDFRTTWRTLLLLQVQIPPECQQDVAEEYRKAKEVMDFKTYNKDKQLELDAPATLRNVISAVTISLYDHGWINKSFSAKPKYEKKGRV